MCSLSLYMILTRCRGLAEAIATGIAQMTTAVIASVDHGTAAAAWLQFS